MVERAGIIVFALWYVAIAYNYYMQNYYRVGMKPRKCRCLMDVPSPTTPCSCSELSTLHGSCNAGPLPGSIKSGVSGRDPMDILADVAEAVAEIAADEPLPEDDSAGGDMEQPQDEEPLEDYAVEEDGTLPSNELGQETAPGSAAAAAPGAGPQHPPDPNSDVPGPHTNTTIHPIK